MTRLFDIDPELITAIKEHRVTFDEWRGKVGMADRLTGFGERNKQAEARFHAAQLYDDMKARCDGRLSIDVAAFVKIMEADAAIRRRTKRRPSRRQLATLVEQNDDADQHAAAAAREAADRAVAHARSMEAGASASASARLAITGYAA